MGIAESYFAVFEIEKSKAIPVLCSSMKRFKFVEGRRGCVVSATPYRGGDCGGSFVRKMDPVL